MGSMLRTHILGIMAAAGGISLMGLSGVFAQGAEQIPAYQRMPPPDLSGFWQHGPIAVFEGLAFKADPVHDLKGALDPTYFGVTFEGDYTAPILKPMAAAEVKRHTEAARAGKPIVTPQEVCEPSGVPNVLTLPAPVQIFQQPEKLVFVYQRDHQVRHIYMNGAHSVSLVPSWYGESVGHYEGDVLVIDTLGMNAKTPVDIFGTPHSEALHVVERLRLINNGRQMEVVFTVDERRKRPPARRRLRNPHRDKADFLISALALRNPVYRCEAPARSRHCRNS